MQDKITETPAPNGTALAPQGQTALAVNAVPKGLEHMFNAEEWAAMAETERAAVTQLWAEETDEGRTIGLDRSLFKITMPGSGGREFSIPNPDGGEPTYTNEIEGVIVWWQAIRDFYEEGELTGKPPVCASPDRIKPYASPTQQAPSCGTCGKAGFGTRGKGKACKEKYRLFMLRDDSDIPMMVTAPTMSAKEFETYATGLKARKLGSPSMVRTIARIVQEEREGGTKYPVLTFRVSDKKMTMDLFKKAKALRETCVALAAQFGITLSENVDDHGAAAPEPGSTEVLDKDRQPIKADAKAGF